MDENTCLEFIFGGCKGSKNMFNTKAACENLCLKDKNGEENALTKINGKVIREHITHIRKAESAKVFLFCLFPPFFFLPMCRSRNRARPRRDRCACFHSSGRVGPMTGAPLQTPKTSSHGVPRRWTRQGISRSVPVVLKIGETVR